MNTLRRTRPLLIAGAVAAGRKLAATRRRQRRKAIALRILGGVLGALTVGAIVRLMSKPEQREKVVRLVKQNRSKLADLGDDVKDRIDDQIRIPESVPNPS